MRFWIRPHDPAGIAALTNYAAAKWYRAPEMLLEPMEYGNTVDIWAIGCIMGELTDGQPLFPGNGEIDQMYIIQTVMGSLTPAQIETFHNIPRFMGIKFPEFSRPEGLEAKYKGGWTAMRYRYVRASQNGPQ